MNKPHYRRTADGETILMHDGLVNVAAKGGATAADKAQTDPVSTYAVQSKGRGWFVVTKDGGEVTKSLREDDVSGFDEFSEADKAAFVEQNRAA